MSFNKHMFAFIVILSPTPAFAQADEQKATVVKLNKGKKETLVKTKDWKRPLNMLAAPKGYRTLTKVTVDYEKKNGDMMATKVRSREFLFAAETPAHNESGGRGEAGLQQNCGRSDSIIYHGLFCRRHCC